MPAPPSPRQELLDRQRELHERVDAIRRDWAMGLDPDLEEQAVQLENQEVLNALLQEALVELQEIGEQLKRDGK